MTIDDVVTMLLAEAIDRVYSATARRADAADDEIPALYASWRIAYDARRSVMTRALRAGWVYR